jgi:hypothetical protein
MLSHDEVYLYMAVEQLGFRKQEVLPRALNHTRVGTGQFRVERTREIYQSTSGVMGNIVEPVFGENSLKWQICYSCGRACVARVPNRTVGESTALHLALQRPKACVPGFPRLYSLAPLDSQLPHPNTEPQH